MILALLFAATSEPVCPAPSPQLERFFTAVAEHASHSKLCSDGMATAVTVKILCAANGRVDYEVTTSTRYGGECDPYPECAKPPPPKLTRHTITLNLKKPPKTIPGVELLTPLARVHDAGCDGKKAAYKR